MGTIYNQQINNLHEQWINGNRKDVFNAISCNPSLCARLALLIADTPCASGDITVFLSFLDAMNPQRTSPNLELIIGDYLAQFGYIASLWHTSDVHDIIDNLGLDPVSDEDALKILQITERNHDSTVGINHDSIECSIQLFYDRK